MDPAIEISKLPSPDQEITWKDILRTERESPYFKAILARLETDRKNGKIIHPTFSNTFNALSLTPFSKVRVVIIGQDPYHGPNQAHGLCFSVPIGVPAPPSLVNIFKELKSDLGLSIPVHGCLENWAKQGVLLLNAVLSVEDGKPQSHASIGWERFTDRIIKEISELKTGVVFLLWGAYAQKKGGLIDRSRHHVLEAVHPSPLSAHRGFLGCKHFSKTNRFLESTQQTPIDWSI